MFSLDFQLTTVFSMTIVLGMITKRRGVFTATATAAMMFLAACSSGETGGSGDAASSASNGDAAASGEGTIEIVASTSVWGDLTKAVIDDESVANVRTIITDTNVDPHHFEPTAADLARANDADVVVAGGGGYDAWLYEPLDDEIVIHALPLTPHEHNSGSENPKAPKRTRSTTAITTPSTSPTTSTCGSTPRRYPPWPMGLPTASRKPTRMRP